MSNKLQELRAKLQEKDNNKNNYSGDNALYPFWNIPFSTDTDIKPATVRFLPDGDESNGYFWSEIEKIKLSFAGIVGGDSKEVIVPVPCMEMWGETCPVLTEIRPWFKGDDAMIELARKYWKKRSFIFQGFVRDNPLEEADGPENPIRRFSITTGLFNNIRAGLMDADMDDMPTDFINGTDFRIIRTKKGEYANYDTSTYSRKSTSLTPEEVEAIETHKLSNLSDFKPKKPTPEVVAVIEEMFNASVNGEEYDPQRWGNVYKPAGLKFDNAATTAAVAVPASLPTAAVAEPVVVVETPVAETAPWVEPVVEPVVAETAAVSPDGKKPPKDILAEIKARAALTNS